MTTRKATTRAKAEAEANHLRDDNKKAKGKTKRVLIGAT
jgi:hypothetical protein